MSVVKYRFWQNWFKGRTRKAEAASSVQPESSLPVQMMDLDISPDDPFLRYVLDAHGVIEVDKLRMDSGTLARLKSEGIKVTLPLISQGELIGLLNLGARRSEQEYSSEDLRLLTNLATQAAPALRVAQLARQRQAEARDRERLDQELRVARVIQQTLLPRAVPEIPGWKMAALWQPARAVSGDFYDFIHFSDGRMAVIIADVTDKGVPAALVMATTRSVLRAAAEQLVSPGAVLERVNNQLCPDMPKNMYVTCLYLLLDPIQGVVCYANAGHPPAYLRTSEGIQEMRARGMPLGLLEGMAYEEKDTLLSPGDSLLMYSDGLVEAHNPENEMFSFPRLRDKVASPFCSEELVQCLLGELDNFTGPGWEQEDDVTLVTIERQQLDPGPRVVEVFELPSQPGKEMEAMERVAAAAAPWLAPSRLERLKTAVAETVMNAMEHGNHFDDGLPVQIQVAYSPEALYVSITDQGEGVEHPASSVPDLEAKVEGLQPYRGWGLALIEKMVDEIHTTTADHQHTVELVMKLERK